MKRVPIPLLAALFSLLLLLGCAEQPQNGKAPSTEGEPFLGSADAKVVIVVFSDFQCPVCFRSYQTMKQVHAQYGDQIMFVYKHFPITQLHPFAQKAAEASECAADQGMFFEYHDLLFENQNALDVNSLKTYAASIGLDTEEFSICLDSGVKAGAVSADFQEGLELGVSGTPTFYINNQRYVGHRTFEQMKQLIDAELSKAPRT